MTQEYTTKLMNLTVNVQYVWDYVGDVDGPVSLKNVGKEVGTMYLDGKPIEALYAVLVGSGDSPPDGYDCVKRTEYEGKTYDLYIKWVIPEPERSERLWQQFVDEGKPHVKYTN